MASALTSADLLPSVSLPKTQYSTRKEPGPQTKQLPSAVVDSSGVEVKLSCQMSGSTSDVGGLDHRPPFKERFTPSVCSHELDDRRPPSNHRLNPMLVKKACRKDAKSFKEDRWSAKGFKDGAFEEKYWKANFSEPETMDCIGNADKHVSYIKSFFEVEGVDIRSILEIGFGYGRLMEQMITQLDPLLIHGIEPSGYAYKHTISRFNTPKEQLHARKGGEKARRTSEKALGVDLTSFKESKLGANGHQVDVIKEIFPRKLPSVSEDGTDCDSSTDAIIGATGAIIGATDAIIGATDATHATHATDGSDGSCYHHRIFINTGGPEKFCIVETEREDAVSFLRRPHGSQGSFCHILDAASQHSHWEPNPRPKGVYQLGVCTSVLQYLDDKELEEVIEGLSRRVYYLYLTVPTTKEYSRQILELDFDDKSAIHRSRLAYQSILGRHFTFISARLLESKRSLTLHQYSRIQTLHTSPIISNTSPILSTYKPYTTNKYSLI
ncbi:hypothetical protein AAMO2058_001134500 [Amorphochlora amoebiformis]